ncbi:hypothetical protein HP567_011910 [Brevibacillus sp. M2.1A]|uniref:hypothetical protein n=1 Tax=Brevibacillus sp. M2.1A TaxID=2738980 RepID=UPI00156A87D8|nr:hypothetical protein [Brevibacillus sp. M2.1A]MCC8435250.1 hypothetical protein [Brevibacillus sp. M2.1A]
MEAQFTHYQQEEIRSLEKIQTCEIGTQLIFDYVQQENAVFNVATIEEIIRVIFQVEVDQREYLLQIRLAKALSSTKLQP